MMLPDSTLEALTNGRKGFGYNSAGNFIGASGEDAMNLYRIHSAYSMLKLEVKTGIKYSRKVSTLAVVNEILGTNYTRKQKALEHLEGVLAMAGEIKDINPLKTGE